MRRLTQLALMAVIPALAVFMPSASQQQRNFNDGDRHGPWTVRYTGYGTVKQDGSSIVLSPRSASSVDRTHGALVHTTKRCQDADFALTVRTDAQVRQGTANPWEVGWVLWNFHNDTRFYALALKPNGWEVTKQDPAYRGDQRFVATGHDPKFPVGGSYRVAITQRWPQMTISVDGTELVTITDDDKPYRGGSVGLYTEDARVAFSDFDLPPCLAP